MFLNITKAAKYLGVSKDTLRNWEKSGKLVPGRSTDGHRLYTFEQLDPIREKESVHEEVTAEHLGTGEALLAHITKALEEFKGEEILEFGIFKDRGWPGASLKIRSATKWGGGSLPVNVDKWLHELVKDCDRLDDVDGAKGANASS